MPAGTSEPVGQCAIPRTEKSGEAPVLPPVKPRQREKLRDRLYHCKHNGEGWKWAAKKKKISLLVRTRLLTHAREPVRLVSGQTKARVARGWTLRAPGPGHLGLKTNLTKHVCFHL